MNPIETILAAQGMLVLDGAMATQLEARGCDIADELWSAKILLEAPSRSPQSIRITLRQGRTAPLPPATRPPFPGFLRRGLEPGAGCPSPPGRSAAGRRGPGRLLGSAGKPAEPAARPLVAASVGPYGAYLADGSEYRGNYGLDRAQLLDFHRERMALLAQAGADLFACETIPSLEEGLAVARLAEENGLCCWVSFSAAAAGDLRRNPH